MTRRYHRWTDEDRYALYRWWRARQALGNNRTKALEMGISTTAIETQLSIAKRSIREIRARLERKRLAEEVTA